MLSRVLREGLLEPHFHEQNHDIATARKKAGNGFDPAPS